MERQGRHWTALAQIASEEFRGEMLRVRGAAAISEEERLMAVAIGRDERVGRGGHGGQTGFQYAAVNLDAAFDVLTENVVRHDCFCVPERLGDTPSNLSLVPFLFEPNL